MGENVCLMTSWEIFVNIRLLSDQQLFIAIAHFHLICLRGARCSSVVRAFAHGAMGHRINPSWWTH